MRIVLTFLLQRKKTIGLFLLFGTVFAASLGTGLWYFQESPLRSPITSATTLQFLSYQKKADSKPKVIYGFLPYWNIQNVTLQPGLSQVAYFSLTFDRTGQIVERQGKDTEMGFHKLQSDDFLNIIQTARKNLA